LGKVGHYCRFIKDYAAVAKPWTEIVGKDEDTAIKKALAVATPAMASSYRQLKQALLTSPVLAYQQFDSKKPFILDTDWSGDANTIGGVLGQKQSGLEKVIAYGARKLSQSQKNYEPTKGELWAIVHFCLYWRYFLQHSQHFQTATQPLPLAAQAFSLEGRAYAGLFEQLFFYGYDVVLQNPAT
jgi:hypothetical protein